MKKLMWMVCLLVVSVTAQAQFEKGKWIVNPSVTGLGLSYSKSGRKDFILKKARSLSGGQCGVDGYSRCQLEQT